MWALTTFLVSLETQIFLDFGEGLRFRGLGDLEADRDLRDFLKRSRDLEREALLSLGDGEALLLLGRAGGDFETLLLFFFSGALRSAFPDPTELTLLLLLPLLLLPEEELEDPDEPVELVDLERERDWELSPLLSEDELYVGEEETRVSK